MASYSQYSNISQAWGYTSAQTQALIDSGYIPIADVSDLNAIRTTYSGASKRNFAAGTSWETGLINTTGLAGSYILVANIDLTHATLSSLYGGDWYDTTKGWTPIGTYTSADFTGILDGGDYSISNMYQRRGTGTFTGLLGGGLGATIKNLKLLSVDVVSTKTSGAYIGGLAGALRDCALSNVSVTGSISGVGYYFGGITPYVVKVSAIKKWNKVSFNGTISTTGYYVGGLIGYMTNYALKITNCYALGSITGDNSVGGLIGYVQYNNSTQFCGIYDSFAACVITGNANTGGAVGSSSYTTVDRVYYDSTVSGQSDVDKGEGRTTSQMKTPIRYTTTVDSDLVYDGWSGYLWNFGTTNDYPVFYKRQIDGYVIPDFQAVWTKYGSNPLYVPAGREIYPCAVIKVGSTYHLTGKENDNKLGYIYSSDGINWTETDPLLIDTDMPETWKEFGKYEYNTWIYRDGLYYLIFGIVFSDVTSGVGYATSSSPGSGYTINSTLLLDPDSNTTESVLGMNFTYLTAPEGIRVGDTWHWYLTGIYSGSYYILHYTSPNSDWLNWTLQGILFNGGDFNYLIDKNSIRSGNCLQIPRVYFLNGYYYMTMTIGSLDNIVNQRYIYVFRSTTPDGFSIDNWQRTPIITPDAGDDQWNEMRVYCHDILKENDDYRLTPLLVDNKIRVYFSGHSFNPGHVPVLTGVPGLAELSV